MPAWLVMFRLSMICGLCLYKTYKFVQQAGYPSFLPVDAVEVAGQPQSSHSNLFYRAALNRQVGNEADARSRQYRGDDRLRAAEHQLRRPFLYVGPAPCEEILQAPLCARCRLPANERLALP